MSIDIPNSAATAGLPASGVDSVTVPPMLVTGDSPPLRAESEAFGESLNYAAYTVVGRVTSGGAIIKSVQNASDGSQNPIGFLAIAVLTGSGGSAKAPVYKSGVVNPDALVWDASWNTDEKKRLAFKVAAPLLFVQPVKTADD